MTDIKLPLAAGALFYNIRQTLIQPSLKPGLPLDIFHLEFLIILIILNLVRSTINYTWTHLHQSIYLLSL